MPRIFSFPCSELWIFIWTKYIIWGPLWLASVTQLRVFKTHPCCGVCPYFISFNAQIQFHWIDTLYFVYSFISGLAFLNLAILVVVKWYLIVILVFIFLMTKVVKYLFVCYWPFVCLVSRNLFVALACSFGYAVFFS